MRIRIVQSFITANGPVNHGESFDCPDERAMELINNKFAVPVAATPAARMETPARGALAEIRNTIASTASSVTSDKAAKKLTGARR